MGSLYGPSANDSMSANTKSPLRVELDGVFSGWGAIAKSNRPKGVLYDELKIDDSRARDQESSIDL